MHAEWSVDIGPDSPALEVPWFWSDQFALRLQFAGLPFDATETVIRGDPATSSFAIFHLTAEGTLQAVEAVNAAPEFMVGRMMIARRQRIAGERLRNPSLSMRDLAA